MLLNLELRYRIERKLFNSNWTYAHLIAYTKEVKSDGNVTQNHSGKRIKNAIQAINEIKKPSQYFDVEFVSTLIVSSLCGKFKILLKIIFE